MISFPFNANITGYDDDGMPIFDRAIDALTQRQLTRLFYTNGVHADNNGQTNFKVNAGTGMTVIVKPGSCCVEGVFGIEDEDRTLAIQAADSSDRIDRVVLRLNDVERKIDLYVLKGTPGSSPQAPALTRPISGESGDIYELGIADVFIPKNTASIAQDRITDTRLNSSLCGIIATPNTVIDASSYYTQFQAAMNSSMETFNAWFETIQGILGEDEAGNLLNLINQQNAVITLLNQPVILNKSISPSSFVSSSDFSYYPYHADIVISGLLETDICQVNPTPDTIEQRCLSSVNQAFAGKLRIYAVEKPSSTVMIDSILINRRS